MGLIRRRVNKLDRARLELFTLEPGERPIETQIAEAIAGWPTRMGVPVPPSKLDQTDGVMGAGVAWLNIPAMMVLTDRRLLWRPYRTYSGRPALRKDIDAFFSEGAPVPKGFHAPFPHPALGERSVPLGTIKQATVDIYDPAVMALLTIEIRDADLSGGSTWPRYQMTGLEESVRDEHGVAEEGGAYLQFVVQNPATLTFAFIFPEALKHLGVTLDVGLLDDDELADWKRIGSYRKKPWRPLYDRLENP